MAQMLIRESSDLDEDTEEDFGPQETNALDIDQLSRTILQSKNMIDRRLVSAYQVKRFCNDYKIHKGKTSLFKSVQEEEP